MKQAWLQVCTFVLMFQYFWTAADSFSHVCYMESPMKSPDALPFAKVDVDLCSHIIMGFATVGNDYSVDLNPIGGYEALTSFAELRKKRPSLKLMVSVGGGGGDKNFKEMTSTESNRQRFINSTAWALRTNNIDGLDLDWEFPEVSDAANFVSLLEEASVELKREPLHPLLLSVAVPAPVTLVLNRYHIPDISKSVDFVNLMTYDLHVYQWYLPFVDHNSPLFPRAGELPVLNMLNLASSANLWAELGMPKSKIMVGIPTYGLSWVLANPSNWKVGSLATGRGKHGDGFVSFAEVCALLKAGAQREYDAESKVPYLHEEKLWVSYDDQESVTLKALWIMSNEYGGTMTFSLNADDWQRKCGNDTFPLQKAIANISDGSSAQGF
ncbi:chitotriosidase-1 isoform X1 [Rhipicephalus microplus]|uniref:chitotriosidase-1 isoform X1 n=1 Tax=Rhipicephalus microplus TaxID=6941 RepID=UPI003F6C49C6